MKLCSVVMLLTAAVAIPPSVKAATISVLPGSQVSVTTGNQVGVDLTISGLGAGTAPSLGVYDVSITFNSALLSFANVSWGTGLDVLGLGSIRNVQTSSGLVNMFELSLDSAADLNALQSPSFLLASLQFTGIGTGVSNISVAINALGDASGASLSANVVYGTPTSIPEPSSWILFLTAGITFWVWSHYRWNPRSRF